MFCGVKSESKQYFQKLFMFSRCVLSVVYSPSHEFMKLSRSVFCTAVTYWRTSLSRRNSASRLNCRRSFFCRGGLLCFLVARKFSIASGSVLGFAGGGSDFGFC